MGELGTPTLEVALPSLAVWVKSFGVTFADCIVYDPIPNARHFYYRATERDLEDLRARETERVEKVCILSPCLNVRNLAVAPKAKACPESDEIILELRQTEKGYDEIENAKMNVRVRLPLMLFRADP